MLVHRTAQSEEEAGGKCWERKKREKEATEREKKERTRETRKSPSLSLSLEVLFSCLSLSLFKGISPLQSPREPLQVVVDGVPRPDAGGLSKERGGVELSGVEEEEVRKAKRSRSRSREKKKKKIRPEREYRHKKQTHRRRDARVQRPPVARARNINVILVALRDANSERVGEEEKRKRGKRTVSEQRSRMFDGRRRRSMLISSSFFSLSLPLTIMHENSAPSSSAHSALAAAERAFLVLTRKGLSVVIFFRWKEERKQQRFR